MSIPVPVERADGGGIGAGDRVDVLAGDGNGGASYVAQGLMVVAVSPTRTSGVLAGASSDFWVTVAVDRATALRLTAALGASGAAPGTSLEVVRSTGETAPAPQTSYAPTVGRPVGECGPLSSPTSPVAMLVGLGATRAVWSADLRAYVRNHMTAMSAEPVLDARQLSRAGKRRFDAVVIDDTTRIFRPGDVGAVLASGTVVIGLFDAEVGLGRRYLEDLGVSRLLPVSVPTAELAAELARVGPVNAAAAAAAPDAIRPAGAGARRRGVLSVWSAVSGGAGLSEVVVAAAELSSERSATVLIEANPISAVLGARLGRDQLLRAGLDVGSSWPGTPGLPQGLTPAGTDEARRKIHFDVICQTVTPDGPPPVNPGTSAALVDEALAGYDQVLVEVGSILGPTPLGGWIASPPAGRCSPEPTGWSWWPRRTPSPRHGWWSGERPRSSGVWPRRWWRCSVGCQAGAGSRPPHLPDLVDRSTGAGFAAVHRASRGPGVGRARWNGELVWRGRWRAAVDRLAAEMAATDQPAPGRPAVRAVG